MHEAGHDVRERAAVLREQRGDVLDRLLCLLRDSGAGEPAAVGQETALAGEEDPAVGGPGGREGEGLSAHVRIFYEVGALAWIELDVVSPPSLDDRRPRSGRRRSCGLWRNEAQAARALVADDRLALPARARARSLYLAADDDDRATPWCDPIERAFPARNPAVDCFYVYPTISGEPTINADRTIGFREQEIAIAQASRFSQVCRVFAPVYRQITLSALEHPARITVAHALVAYDSVLSAFRDYLAHYNKGRGIVFIGHSQGAAILIRLLKQEVDRAPPLRRRLVSALLLGGNVTVRKGSRVGGDFLHIPACSSRGETGCVVAYSSFMSKPPQNSQFGRTTSDAGVRLLAPHDPSPNIEVMCVNPAALAGGAGVLDPYVPALVLRSFRAAAHRQCGRPGSLSRRVHRSLRVRPGTRRGSRSRTSAPRPAAARSCRACRIRRSVCTSST